MQIQQHPLQGGAAAPAHVVTSLHFGPAGTRRALLQCSLHADEIPPMLVGQHLRRALQRLEDAGQLLGEVLLLPACNPIGLAQQAWGRLQGRFEIASGQNFNRHYPQLAAGAAQRFSAGGGRLRADAGANAAALRQALQAELAAQGQGAMEPLQQLRHTLLGLALPADLVLDLHCDNEATLHLYATPEHQAQALQLAQCLGAPLVLLAAESGDHPFDEAVSGIWPALRAQLGPAVPLAAFAATVELRGETDVAHALAAADALGLLRFLQAQGFIASLEPLQPGPQPPAPPCALRPLAGCMRVVAPATGVLVWHEPLPEQGQWVRAGHVLGELVCPVSGQVQALASPVDGLLFARELQRWARAGQAVAKVAGEQALRSGRLLSA